MNHIPQIEQMILYKISTSSVYPRFVPKYQDQEDDETISYFETAYDDILDLFHLFYTFTKEELLIIKNYYSIRMSISIENRKLYSNILASRIYFQKNLKAPRSFMRIIKNESQENCPICIQNKDFLCKLAVCSHTFCTDCISEMVDRNILHVCPLCRQSIYKEHIHTFEIHQEFISLL